MNKILQYFNSVNNNITHLGLKDKDSVYLEDYKVNETNFPKTHVDITRVLSSILEHYCIHLETNESCSKLLYIIFTPNKKNIARVKRELRKITTELPISYVILAENNINYDFVINTDEERKSHYETYCKVIDLINDGFLKPVNLKQNIRKRRSKNDSR